MYLGDIALGATLDFKFTSRAFATGAPTTLSGTPVLSAYPGNSTTQLTAGITLSVDFDSVTGLNQARIVASSGNGYVTATDYAIVITTGTVGGVSVVGETVGHFSIENRSALRPATAGRTLVVDAAGLADATTVKLGPSGSGSPQTARDVGLSVLLSSGTGTGQLKLASGYTAITWADIAAPTTTVNLSGTTVKTATDVETDTQDIQSRLPAALTVAGNIKADALAISGDVTAADNAESFFDGTGYAGTNNVIPLVTTVTNLTNAATSGDFTATMKTSITTAVPTANGIADQVWDEILSGHLGAGSTGAALNAAGSAGDPWTTALPGGYSSGQAGYIIGTYIDAAITSRMATYTQPTGFLAATFPTGTIANTTNITAGTITTTTNLTNAATNGDFTATMKTSIGTAVVASAVASVTGNVSGSVASVVGAVGSVTGNVGGNVVGSVGSVTGLSVAAILTTGVTESYRADGAAPTLAQFACEVLAHLGEASISGVTKTINKFDHSTPAETFTLNDATVPTSITRAT